MYLFHNHTDYSNSRGTLDCINSIDDLVDTALDMGIEGIAITDHDILSGSYKFLQKIKKVNEQGREELEENPNDEKAKLKSEFRGFIGNEVYLAREGLNKETHEKKEKFHHLILIAKDKKGWEQLNELSSTAWNRMYVRGRSTRTPTYLSDLKRVVGNNPGHVICTTACLGNYLGHRIIEFGTAKDERREELKEEILNHISEMKEIFGDDFYLETQPNSAGDQLVYNQGLSAFAKHTNTPLVVTTDSHYNRPEWREVHHAYLNSQSDKERETIGFYDYTYIMSEKEIRDLLSFSLDEFTIQECVENTKKIADKIEDYSIDHPEVIPTIPFEHEDKWADIIHQYDNRKWFKTFSHSNKDNQFFLYEIINGIHDYLDKDWIKLEDTLDRVEIELETIWLISERLGQNMSSYFTTMKKIIDLTWDISIVAPGRGSAGAFMINYLLGITQIDPMSQPVDHPYWRFLHPDKVAFPDVDFDSGSSRREKVIEYLKEWFETIGATITNIATFGTEKSKSAIITAARSQGYEPEDGLYFASLIPSSRGILWKLEEAYYGDGEDKKPVKEFIKEMDNHPEVWKIAKRIEGLISKRGVHAAGIVIFNGSPYEYGALMKSPSGAVTTQYSLDDLEKTGSMKYDLLSTDAVDSIQTEMYLLAEHGYIEWQGDLRSTYDKYLHPKELDYDSPRMWEMANNKEILSLFQFGDSPVGEQAIEEVKPTSLLELATINSVMRLMAAEGKEMPLIQYRRRKENPNLWHMEMANAGLTKEEQSILEEYVGETLGMCITQEQLMLLLQDKKVANFSYIKADKARKVVAKKKTKEIEKLKQQFYTKAKECGARIEFTDYIWFNLFQVQLGYSFSQIHTVSYSIIALQEMNLNYNYPSIFWANARLMSESGSTDFLIEDLEILEDEKEEDDEDITQSSVNYFKMSSAIGKIKDFGVKIAPPDINLSSFTFKPVVEENTIYFGLKGLNRIGNKLIYEIIENRPYSSLDDFLSKVKVNKVQATMLIKSGAFDSFGDRREMLEHYCDLVADKKNRITLQNMARLIELDFIPEYLESEKNIFLITKHLKKYFKFGDLIVPDENMWQYINKYDFNDIEQDKDGTLFFSVKKWESFYKKKMNKVRDSIKENHDEILQKVNKAAVDELIEKYGKGNIAQWEMEALSTYHSYHELDTPEYQSWLESLKTVDFNTIPEEPEIEWEGSNGAKKFKLYTIAGTAIGRDKQKNIVGVLTSDGFLKVKVYRSTFNKFDRQIKLDGETEKSWFSKGNKLLLTGYRDGDNFKLKTYKSTPGQMIYKIMKPGNLESKRLGE